MNRDRIIVAATIRAASSLLAALPDSDGPTTGDGITDDQGEELRRLVDELQVLASRVERGL